MQPPGRPVVFSRPSGVNCELDCAPGRWYRPRRSLAKPQVRRGYFTVRIQLRHSLLAVVLLSAAAARLESVGREGDESPRAWFVELSSPPTIEGTSRSTTDSEKQAFRNAAKQAGLKFQERFSYDN